MSLTSIVTWIIVGGIAGFLAERVIGGFHIGCIGTVIVGIIGAFIGGWLFGLLHISIGTGIINTIITSFVGAVVLLVILRALRGGRRR
jgi:uncharacterized membrane protein YeaQ/YmgE (transglycosylase-associated protein family)